MGKPAAQPRVSHTRVSDCPHCGTKILTREVWVRTSFGVICRSTLDAMKEEADRQVVVLELFTDDGEDRFRVVTLDRRDVPAERAVRMVAEHEWGAWFTLDEAIAAVIAQNADKRQEEVAA